MLEIEGGGLELLEMKVSDKGRPVTVRSRLIHARSEVREAGNNRVARRLAADLMEYWEKYSRKPDRPIKLLFGRVLSFEIAGITRICLQARDWTSLHVAPTNVSEIVASGNKSRKHAF